MSKFKKELQRIIALHGGINLSVDKMIDIAKTIPTIKLNLPYGDTERIKPLFLTEKHLRIKPLFDIKAILGKKQKTNRRTREQGDASPKSGEKNYSNYNNFCPTPTYLIL